MVVSTICYFYPWAGGGCLPMWRAYSSSACSSTNYSGFWPEVTNKFYDIVSTPKLKGWKLNMVGSPQPQEEVLQKSWHSFNWCFFLVCGVRWKYRLYSGFMKKDLLFPAGDFLGIPLNRASLIWCSWISDARQDARSMGIDTKRNKTSHHYNELDQA